MNLTIKKRIAISFTVFLLILSVFGSSLIVSADVPPIYDSAQVDSFNGDGLAYMYRKATNFTSVDFLFDTYSTSVTPVNTSSQPYFASGPDDVRIEISAPLDRFNFGDLTSFLYTQEISYDFSVGNLGKGYFNGSTLPICNGISFTPSFYGGSYSFDIPYDLAKNYPYTANDLANFNGSLDDASIEDFKFRQTFDWKLQAVEVDVYYRVGDNYKSTIQSDYIYGNDTFSFSEFEDLSLMNNPFGGDSLTNAVRVHIDQNFTRPVQLIKIDIRFIVKFSFNFGVTDAFWSHYSAGFCAKLRQNKCLINFKSGCFLLKKYSKSSTVSLFDGLGEYLDPSGVVADKLDPNVDAFISGIKDKVNFDDFPTVVEDNKTALSFLGGLAIMFINHEPWKTIVLSSCVVIVISAFIGVIVTKTRK